MSLPERTASGNLRKFRVLWWAVLAVILAAAGAALTVYAGRLNGSREGRPVPGLLGEASPTGFAFWVILILGLVCAVAGARLGRSVFQPGWRLAERMAERAREQHPGVQRHPAFGIYLVALGLIEAAALLGLLLFLASGSFQTWIFMTGVSLLGWLVVRPEGTGERDSGDRVEKPVGTDTGDAGPDNPE